MILILGYGLTGKATEAFFKEKGQECLIFDDNLNLNPSVSWKEIKQAIKSPGVSLEHPLCIAAKDQNVPIFSDLNIFQQQYPNVKTIGITGTNGKSTITHLIHHILQHIGINSFVCGNIGVPALSIKPSPTDVAIMELSSYHLEMPPYNLDTAIWSNISPDHLDRHGTMENYVNAKKRIFLQSKYSVIGIDDDYSKKVSQELNQPVCVSAKFGTDFSYNKTDVFKGDHLIYQRTLEHLPGKHNSQNIALAIAACMFYEKNLSLITNAINTFKGVEHRLEKVLEIENITFINDSKATNVESALTALNAYDTQPLFWLCGGKAKDENYSPLGKHKANVQKTYIFGNNTKVFQQSLENTKHDCFPNLDSALAAAIKDAKKYKNPCIILLSPAAASFDAYKNFMQRGEHFKQLIREKI